MSTDKFHVIKSYVDVDFDVNVNFKSHTGDIMDYGRGLPISKSMEKNWIIEALLRVNWLALMKCLLLFFENGINGRKTLQFQ